VDAGRKRWREAQGAHFRLDRLHGISAAEHVPHIGRDQAVGTNHPCHFPDTFGWVGHEVDHQRHDSGIEPVGFEGQHHGVPLQKYRACCPWPGAREGELRLGRIDALRFDRRAALDELLGESPVAAAHVDPPLARGGRQPIEEDLPHELAPGAHHALVGCSIIEPNGLLDHWRRPPLITGFTTERH